MLYGIVIMIQHGRWLLSVDLSYRADSSCNQLWPCSQSSAFKLIGVFCLTTHQFFLWFKYIWWRRLYTTTAERKFSSLYHLMTEQLMRATILRLPWCLNIISLVLYRIIVHIILYACPSYYSGLLFSHSDLYIVWFWFIVHSCCEFLLFIYSKLYLLCIYALVLCCSQSPCPGYSAWTIMIN